MTQVSQTPQKVQILIGNIASGKSTWSASRAKEDFLIVSSDLISSAVHGGVYTKWSEDCRDLYNEIESTIAWTALELGRSVVIDKTNVTKRAREKWINMSRSFGARCEAILFPFCHPDKHAHARFNSDSRGVTFERWKQVANDFDNSYQEPTLDEGFDEIIRLPVFPEFLKPLAARKL
jgi:predicted kinase